MRSRLAMIGAMSAAMLTSTADATSLTVKVPESSGMDLIPTSSLGEAYYPRRSGRKVAQDKRDARKARNRRRGRK